MKTAASRLPAAARPAISSGAVRAGGRASRAPTSTLRQAQGSGRRDAVARKLLPALALALAGIAVGAAPNDGPSPSFRDDFDGFDRGRWYVADGWANGEHQNCTWSKRQLDLGGGMLTLSFEKRKAKDRQYACAEIQSHKRFSYGTYEARLKTDVGSGVNAAFFTFIGPAQGEPHDEIDFEVLTKDTSKVSVNTFVGGKPKNGAEVEVAGGTDSGFNDYAFVWEKDRLRWYVNGELKHEAKSPAELPSRPQKIFFSLWGSDTLDDWMGVFADPGRKLTMDVDWVAFTALGDKCQFPDSVACNLE